MQGTKQHWGEEKHEFHFAPAKLQILLIFEDKNMKGKKEFGAKIGDLEEIK